MGKLKIKQKKKAFIPYTNQQAHMFAQSIQNCQKELKEMERKPMKMVLPLVRIGAIRSTLSQR